ncbi:MAG: Uma2 family endonuclease [Anaerolineales bacterium]|nr:Uma2 family endonuclease [Anaerolineales bacterium]
MAAQTILTPEVMAPETGSLPQEFKKSMPYDEFLAWANEDIHAEWVNGEVIIFMPPLNPHQTVIEFLYQLLNLFSSVFDLGRLRIAPFELKLTLAGNSREPDLMFIAKAHLERLTTARVIGPPDLIIEVVSDDSTHRDRVDKFDEYEAGGVPEYWIIDNRPQRRRPCFTGWTNKASINLCRLRLMGFIALPYCRVSGCGLSGCGPNSRMFYAPWPKSSARNGWPRRCVKP